MQNIVIDKPYAFVGPHRGNIWPRLLSSYAMRTLRKQHGFAQIDVEHAGRLADSIRAGHGILLAPNHSRDIDPMVLGALSSQVRTPFFIMASWHLFMQSRLKTFLLRRAGAFSIYREGMDRAALNTAAEILEEARRPLVVFPEGVVSRANDRLNPLMDGVALMARSAAKKRAKLSPPGKVVIHPVGIRYQFMGDLEQSLSPVLDEMEARLAWRPQRQLPLIERVYKIGYGLLALKEIELLGMPQQGTVAQRLERLIDYLLMPLEQEYLDGLKDDGGVVARVKRLRIAMLPDMVKGELDEAERQRRWRQLGDCYLAQQLAFYPPDYIQADPTPERLLETVERFEEDITDTARPHPPMRAIIRVGEAIEVTEKREKTADGGDAVMAKLEQQLRELLGIPASEGTSAPAPA